MSESNGTENVRRIVVKVDEDRIQEMLTVDQYLAVQEGEMRAIVEMCSKVLWDEKKKQYYDPSEAREMLGALSLKELIRLAESINAEMEEEAVPKNLEGESE